MNKQTLFVLVAGSLALFLGGCGGNDGHKFEGQWQAKNPMMGGSYIYTIKNDGDHFNITREDASEGPSSDNHMTAKLKDSDTLQVNSLEQFVYDDDSKTITFNGADTEHLTKVTPDQVKQIEQAAKDPKKNTVNF